MSEKGYIKFHCHWIKDAPLCEGEIADLESWRDRLHEAGLIGITAAGYGYGNISTRTGNTSQFVITGSNTGNFKHLDGSGYTRVISYDIAQNTLICRGPIQASSESLTHAAIYSANPRVKAVVHVHSLSLWKQLVNVVPTSSRTAEYGTPEMAFEMIRLVTADNLPDHGLIAMGGHCEGLVSFGIDLPTAAGLLLSEYEKQ